MKNKNVFIVNIVKIMMIVLILFWIFFSNSGIARLIIVPFITCALFALGKNISFLLNKENLANVFSKSFIISFLVFWFGFLIVWSYYVIKDNTYFTLLFTLPFWIIGIYIIRKFLLKTDKTTSSINSKVTSNFKIIVTSFLVIIILLLGILLLFVGIKDTYKLNKKTKDYVQTTGSFVDYEIYNPNAKDITYKLTYVFEVKGMKYFASTDYGVTSLPDKNSVREIKYNPNNPDESILIGTNSKNTLIYFGGFFTLGATAFILAFLYVKGVFSKIKFDIMGLYLGFVFLIVGIGFIMFQGGLSSFSETIKSLGIFIIIPILFIGVGIFQIIKCIFFI